MKCLYFILLISLIIIQSFAYYSVKNSNRKLIAKRALEKSHEKPPADKWLDKFRGKNFNPTESMPSLVNLIYKVTEKYLTNCVPILLYEKSIKFENFGTFKNIFKHFPVTFVHGDISEDFKVTNPKLLGNIPGKCQTYIIFLKDVMNTHNIINWQTNEKVLIVSWSSQWRVQEFLTAPIARKFVNLLVIGRGVKNALQTGEEATYLLYTHKLYTDGLGSSSPLVLTSWFKNKFVRPSVNLFPPKLKQGFAGHRFIVSLANQPPFVIKRRLQDKDGGNDRIEWDGVEIRLINLLSTLLNFTVEFREPNDLSYGSGDSVCRVVSTGGADIGIAGIYVTNERISIMDVSFMHSWDCATFISLTSTALPKYRAIMGPFHWSVWLSLTFTYLIAIFPLAFSDKLSLYHLIENPSEVENMFWYVFGTFTNCFSFTGDKSWSKSNKITTRLLIGWYWAFTIIITACYTGSIIAFVTLPVFPSTIDTAREILNGRFRVGTLDRGGWEHWYLNSSDEVTEKLFKKVDLVPDVESGLINTTRAFFWPYAFLGSRALLEYIVSTNFTVKKSKQSLLHISNECFVPYGVSLVFPSSSIYKNEFNRELLQISQYGFVTKILNDVKWSMLRSATGKLLQASSSTSLREALPEDRALTLDDTQGMFLILGLGFALGGASLVSEYVGGCFNYCKNRRARKGSTVSGIDQSFHSPTPTRANALPNDEIVNCSDEKLAKKRTENSIQLKYPSSANVHKTQMNNGDGIRNRSKTFSSSFPKILTCFETDKKVLLNDAKQKDDKLFTTNYSDQISLNEKLQQTRDSLEIFLNAESNCCRSSEQLLLTPESEINEENIDKYFNLDNNRDFKEKLIIDTSDQKNGSDNTESTDFEKEFDNMCNLQLEKLFGKENKQKDNVSRESIQSE